MKNKDDSSVSLDGVLSGLAGGIIFMILVVLFVCCIRYVQHTLSLLGSLTLIVFVGPLFCYEVMLGVYRSLSDSKHRPPKRALIIIWVTFVLFLVFFVWGLSV